MKRIDYNVGEVIHGWKIIRVYNSGKTRLVDVESVVEPKQYRTFRPYRLKNGEHKPAKEIRTGLSRRLKVGQVVKGWKVIKMDKTEKGMKVTLLSLTTKKTKNIYRSKELELLPDKSGV